MNPTEQTYKLFCDESCHLEKHPEIMVLGAICCSEQEVIAINKKIKEIRYRHSYKTELKWTKLHAKQINFYKEVINLFFQSDGLKFKATVVSNKNLLNHQEFNQGSHNNFYYKMFFYTLRDFLKPNNRYKIYLDYMDTQGKEKTKKLMQVFENSHYQQIDCKAYIIRSYESQIIQLCDLFIGALSYANRKDIEHNSLIKNEIINYLSLKLCRSLASGTAPWEEKFNIFQFSPRGTLC